MCKSFLDTDLYISMLNHTEHVNYKTCYVIIKNVKFQ